MITSLYIKQRVENEFSAPNIGVRHRKGDYPYYRYVYFKLCRDFTKESFAMIGKNCGDRDHSTVKNGIKKFEEDMRIDLPTSRYFIAVYWSLHKNLTIITKRAKKDRKFEVELKTPLQLRQDYRNRLWRIIQKNHKVIKNLSYFRESEIIKKIYSMEEQDIKEFEEFAIKFLNRKQKSLLN